MIGFVCVAGRVALAVGVVAAAAAPVFAQSQAPVIPNGPQRERELVTLQLDVRGASTDQSRSVADGVVVDDVVADIPTRGSTLYLDVNASLRVTPNRVGPLSYAFGVSSAIRRYEGGDEFVVLGHAAGGSAVFAPTTRTTINGTASFSYVPSYSINVMPVGVGDPAGLSQSAGTLPVSALDYSLGRRPAFGTTAALYVSQGLTRRLSLTVRYTVDKLDFDSAADPSFSSQDMAGGLRYELTRGLALRLGYGRRTADFQTDTGVERVAMDDIDAGLSFNRAIGLTRTTTLSFSTGSTIRLVDDSRRATLTGAATLRQAVAGRGALQLTYLRGGDVKAGFGRPVFSDSASLSGSYALTDALTFSAASTALFGNSGQAASADNNVESISGFARLAYRLFRGGQVYADYLAYRSEIGRGVVLIATVPRDYSSRAVRAGFSWSIPLVSSVPPRRRAPRPPRERN